MFSYRNFELVSEFALKREVFRPENEIICTEYIFELLMLESVSFDCIVKLLL